MLALQWLVKWYYFIELKVFSEISYFLTDKYKKYYVLITFLNHFYFVEKNEF